VESRRSLQVSPVSSLAQREQTAVAGSQRRSRTILETHTISQRFGNSLVLDRVSFRVGEGEIHALLGPNGAGKTTLIRILAGLLHPTAGTVKVAGFDPRRNARVFRQQIGFVPSGDRTFYLRISALENLVFFARLHGMSRRAAVRRAQEALAEVGLAEAGRRRVALYSHGMQKRLSVARALVTAPPVLLIDEATHDLDPEGARRVRDLVAAAAAGGAAVVWATQRLEEIVGFADAVTLLDRGNVRFLGSVPQLMALAAPRRFVLQLRGAGGHPPLSDLADALSGVAKLVPADINSSEHFLLVLNDDVVLGHALDIVSMAGLQVLSCREERSNVEEAFLRLTEVNQA
jgi:ABC-2 type transport system ATP-binding protein